MDKVWTTACPAFLTLISAMLGLFLTFSTHELGVKGVPGLCGWERWVAVGEMIEGDHCVFRVSEDHQNLCKKNHTN